MKTFRTSQFGYYPLVWMCHNRNLNNEINNLHERKLRLVYKDRKSVFEELIIRDKSLSVHHKNLQILAREMFKVQNGIAPRHYDILRKRNIT